MLLGAVATDTVPNDDLRRRTGEEVDLEPKGPPLLHYIEARAVHETERTELTFTSPTA